MKIHAALFLALMPAATHAGALTSANYNVPTDTTDAGGRRATSASYTHDGSAGGVAGISTVAAPATTAKAGYLGQTTEVLALQLNAASPNLNERTTLALSTSQLFDDQTTSAVSPGSVTWSVPAGPLSISPAGLATAGTVFQNTSATAQGVYGGLTASLPLTVVNVDSDDVPGYSGDNMDDAWQVLHFGFGNPMAAAEFDPDGDGQTNLLEAAAGLNPLDPSARFLTSSQPAPQPGQMSIVFGPILPGRTYIVETSPGLGLEANWTILTGFSTSDNGNMRTVTDPVVGTKFYRVLIIGP